MNPGQAAFTSAAGQAILDRSGASTAGPGFGRQGAGPGLGTQTGSLWLAWVGFDGNDDEIFASQWDGTSWSLPWQVSADDEDPTLYDRQPRLAVGKNGHPWVVWTGHQSGPDDEIYASHWNGTGWTPETAISHDDDALDVTPTLALDAAGQPWVAWKGRAVRGEHSRLRIFSPRWQASRAAWTDEAAAGVPLSQAVDEEDPLLSQGSAGFDAPRLDGERGR